MAADGTPRRSRAAGVGALAVLAVLAGTTVVTLARGVSAGRGTVPGSSYRADELGGLGARLLLEDLGYAVESRRGVALPRGTGHVLIRTSGLEDLIEEEFEVHRAWRVQEDPVSERIASSARLEAWVRAGNGLLLLGETPEELCRWVPVSSMYAVEPGDDNTLIRERHSMEGLQDPWLSVPATVAVEPSDEVLAEVPRSDAWEPGIVERQVGAGSVVVIPDPRFATNVHLAHAGTDNEAWLAVLVDRLMDGGRGTVVFDDRALGQVASRGVLSLIEEAGFGPALLAGLLLVLVAWWRLGPSDAPDRHTREEAVFAPESFAHIRGDLYAKCMDGSDARRAVLSEVARRLSHGDALPPDRALAVLAARDPEAAADVQRSLDRLPREPGVTPVSHPTPWCRAVTAVWRALERARHGRTSSN